MQNRSKKLHNLFLRQSYLDAWEDYERSLRKSNFIKWDYIVLTASNEAQANAYRQQIDYRLKKGRLPETTKYAVLPDPDGKRVGSGGATFNVLKYIAECENFEGENPFKNKRIMVIHSGGDSKRVPQYSACGKLFSPVPRELPDGHASTLFDEFIIGMSGVPSRFKEGMLILSGDVLLLFNPLQIDFQLHGAAAISMKEPVEIGKNHGVFLNDGQNGVECFLHKQTEERLRELGAVNERGYVDLDTGSVLLDTDLLNSLYSLITTNGVVDENKFTEFVNEKARISFYGDFLYPLANKSTLEQYLKEAPEGSFCEELENCRKKIWEAIHHYSLKLLCLSPAEFIHFGTTKELLNLMTVSTEDYEFLDWKRNVVSNVEDTKYAVHNSFVDNQAQISDGCYIEDSYVGEGVFAGKNSVISNVELHQLEVPEKTVLHGLILKDGSFVVRIYGVSDNPKGTYDNDAALLNTTLPKFLKMNGLSKSDLWADNEEYLWFANLYPVADTMEEAVESAMLVYRMCEGNASDDDISKWKKSNRTSLYASFNNADVSAIVPGKFQLTDQILTERFIKLIESGACYKDAFEIFGKTGITDNQFELLMNDAEFSDFSLKIRIYYYLSRYMKINGFQFDGIGYDKLETMCFSMIQNTISEICLKDLGSMENYKIAKDRVDISLPVRVNWGGGWTDTPPYCNEKGGAVLNAAIMLRGEYPVQVSVKKLKEYHIEFESEDIGVSGVATSIEEIQNCNNPYDSFALHKAALIACGVIPVAGQDKSLEELLKQYGGGIYVSTQVVDVPKGSGLGTSSILAGACVKAIFEFFDRKIEEQNLYDVVLCMEQIMSTGGGWQDQVGGLSDGIKWITSAPGLKQSVKVEKVNISEDNKTELMERFALIYTGQRRLARNLLRDVVGNYIGNRSESLVALDGMKRTAVLMKYELEHGSIDEFARLLNEHWELSKQLDSGSSNTCIDQIFNVCEDLIDGRFISGAGGGGFLQVILKKNVTQEMLQNRLSAVFEDSGVAVWDCELIF